MAQKLILPINKMRVTASWKTAAYRARFGMVHYGTDCVSTEGSAVVWAGGDGEVLAAGWDSVFGNAAVVRYPAAYNHVSKQTADLIVRYFHFASLAVKRGQRVSKDTRLGLYGATGQYVSGAHLHVEVDTDLNWPLWTPSLSGQSTMFKGSRLGAHDWTMTNPLEWMHCKTSAPDRQTYRADANNYIREEDRTIPEIV